MPRGSPFLIALALTASGAPAPTPLTYETFARLHERLLRGETAAGLEDALPGLSRGLALAAEVSREHWTDCTPFDELAKDYILSDAVLDALGIPRERTGGVLHVPAGTMHTYGYLFSQLRTPYGLKGKRWLESRLDERLGLPAGTFGPLAPQGEFASNVTSVLLRLVGSPARLRGAARLRPRARALGRVEERVSWRTAQGRRVEAVVSTHLVELAPLADSKSNDSHLLVYSMRRGGRVRLVTAFPVDESFAASIRAAKPVRDSAFKPRFNLYVDPSWTVVERVGSGFRPARRRG